MNNPYNYEYYHCCCGPVAYEEPEHWVSFFGTIADHIVNDLHPKTVLDAGCAMGYLVGALRDRGVEAYGIDISEYAVSQVREDIKSYCVVGSLTEAFPDSLPKHFDLVVTIEVLEHLYAEDGRIAIQKLCELSDQVLFASTPDDFTEKTHVNVQQREYWARLFAENGFYDDLSYRPTYLTYYATLFKKSENLLRQIEDYERYIRTSESQYRKDKDSFNKTLELYEKYFPRLNCPATIYFNQGDGYSDNNSIIIHYNASPDVVFSIDIPDGCRSIRFDPIEGSFCIIRIINATADFGDISYRNLNGKTLESTEFFLTRDPQMEFLFEEPIHLLQIRVSICVFEDPLVFKSLSEFQDQYEQNQSLIVDIDKQKTYLDKELTDYKQQNEGLKNQITELEMQVADLQNQLDQTRADAEMQVADLQSQLDQTRADAEMQVADLQSQIEEAQSQVVVTQETMISLEETQHITENELLHYKEHYHAAINQREDLKRQLATAQYEYGVISNAFFWKITKPMRASVDFLYRFPCFLIPVKVLKSIKNTGWRNTWIKAKRKIKNDNEYKKSLNINQLNQDAVQKTNIQSEPIKFSILVPLYNTQEQFLRELIQSVQVQDYQNWELCLADGSDFEHPDVQTICLEYAKDDPRILYLHLDENRGISSNTNKCSEMATGDYLALLDHDDVLSLNALAANAQAILETGADVLYSDEDHLSVDGKYINPFFKPDWSPDLLYCQMYIGHLLVFKKELFTKIGGFRPEYDGSQDYDLMLRLSEETDKICHIPLVLYHWRESPTSTAANAAAKPYAHEAGRSALEYHLKKEYGDVAEACDGEYTFLYDARFGIPEHIKVSIIIPMRDKWELTDQCVRSIVEKSSYQNYEILILDNRSVEQTTFLWLDQIRKLDPRVKVIAADMEFNWSAINNFGVKKSTGDVLVFLNNDTLVITDDWLDRLVENALRKDIGVVGALLLYPDNTIQHAGVVVGIGGWADHIYKGMEPIHYGSPFVSPALSRNVLAVTGACMAISREHFEDIGPFDESFVICGSDVELCIRAHEKGYFNLYNSRVKLYHLESKSRDAYIPDVDFQKSYKAYEAYRENIDPYYNINLDRDSVKPKIKMADINMVNYQNFKSWLKSVPVLRAAYAAVKELSPSTDYRIPEIEPINCRPSTFSNDLRLNLLIPSVDEKHVFGGIATALRFFESLQVACNCPARIIITDAFFSQTSSKAPAGYIQVPADKESNNPLQIVPFADRSDKTIPVGKGDIFLATGWWTAYAIQKTIQWQKKEYGRENPLIYFIQDFEPGFYPWSSRYLMADSTYRFHFKTYAIINSRLLKTFLINRGYRFDKSWYFEPALNPVLKEKLPTGTTIHKKKQIIIYGRPGTERNAFSLIVYALKEWVQVFPKANEWTILSAGEAHSDIELAPNIKLKSLGKLTLEKYAEVLKESYAGISLMVSPHPSYPPLEMSSFGIRTITNRFENKDLSYFNSNIISLSSASSESIAIELARLCDSYDGVGHISITDDYKNNINEFEEISKQLCSELSCDNQEF